VGPGVRSTLGKGVFFDLDLLYRLGRSYDFGPFDSMDLDGFELSEDRTVRGGRLEAALIADQRNDGLEPTAGYFLAGRVAASPGGALASHRYVTLSPEARGYLPISKSWSLAARGSAGWVFGSDDAGVPLETRFFGGGAYGMRGFGRQQLSPELCMGAMGGDCEKVGGLSLVESSVEARYLPFRELVGLSLFADVGGAGAKLDPFADGLSAAVGVGARLRSWYVPIAIDFATRVVDRGDSPDFGSLDPYLVFVRIGESF
jgi:translocation and assembly module TamA